MILLFTFLGLFLFLLVLRGKFINNIFYLFYLNTMVLQKFSLVI